MPTLSALVLAMLLTAGPENDNPWTKQVKEAVRAAEQRGNVTAFRDALDTTWRADDWEAGLKLAQRALKEHADRDELRGMVVRALWRAGRIADAEKHAAAIPEDTTDRVAIRARTEIALARGELDAAQRWAERLEQLGPRTAEDVYHLFGVRFARQDLKDLPALVRKAQQLLSPRNGYPETHLGEAIEGLADYFEAVGTEPLNRVSANGAATMSPLVLVNLPSCDVFINGRGPYRMVIDTGGSIMLALDQAVADEIGLKSVARANVRGVSGKQETGQAVIDELRLGDITCRRVLTRVFDVRGAIMNAADGVLGTGIFADARMTLDFVGGRLVVTRSGAEQAPGRPTELRLVGDAKLMVPVTIQDEPAVALLDTGADAIALAPSLLRRLYPDRPIRTMELNIGIGIGADETPGISLNPGVDLKLAGRDFRNYGGLGLDVLDKVLGPVLGMQADVLIGMPTFREMRSLTVDFPQCKMWVDWLK